MVINKIYKYITLQRTFLIIFFLLTGFLAVESFFSPAVIQAKTIDFTTVPESFSSLAEMVSPAVVNIRTEKIIRGGGRVFRHFSRNPFGKNDPFHNFFDRFFDDEGREREYTQRSLGSGFIIDKDGYIVTNNHVIENADKIKVKLKNGKEFEAEIVGRDPNTDLALIKIKTKNDLPDIKLGDSDALKVGQWVMAIGSPFGLEHTVTAGIVSAKGRVIGSGPYDDFIQTDASINPGNSGGPLINMKGEVVGINTAIHAGGQGIGFAVPINLAKGVIEQLKKYGEVTRGWLGVTIQSLNRDLAEYYGIEDGKGVLVVDVVPGDPADEAGIKPKDIILEVNDKKVATSRDLTKMIAGIGVGEEVKVKVLRDRQEMTFKVRIGKRPEKQVAIGRPKKDYEDNLGIRVSKLSPETAQKFNITNTKGVFVIDIEPGSKGEKAGVLAGDIIKEVNHKPIKTVKDYHKVIKKIKKDKPINMFIWRRNAGFLVIKLTK